MHRSQTVAALIRNVGKRAVSHVPKKKIAEFVRSHVRKLVHIIVEMPPGNKDIAVAVVVEVDQAVPPSHVRQRLGSCLRRHGNILKKNLRLGYDTVPLSGPGKEVW